MISDENHAKPTRVMLVEDHASFRQALTLVLNQERDFSVVAQAGSLSEARSIGEGVDFAVVDLALPDGSGIDLIEDLRRVNRDLTILVLSATLDDESLARVVDAGAAGVVDKLAGLDEIIHEARRLRAGAAMPRQREVSEVLRTIAWYGKRHRELHTETDLTAQEIEVLKALAEGLDSEGVAKKLGITVEVERDLVSSFLHKLGARSSLQALAIAARRGLVDLA